MAECFPFRLRSAFLPRLLYRLLFVDTLVAYLGPVNVYGCAAGRSQKGIYQHLRRC